MMDGDRPMKLEPCSSDWQETASQSDEALVEERAVMVCPQCEGEGGYPDGLDEAACHTECTRCGGNGWIVDLAALRTAEPSGNVAELVERKQFPILGSNGAKIDWQLVADHGKHAKANHYQTVERLAERGGLSWCELHAVLHNRPWQKMDENTAINECRKVEAEYLNAATLTTLSRRNAELEAFVMQVAERDDSLGDDARTALTGGNDA